jgi:LacI family transcriptional regulator
LQGNSGQVPRPVTIVDVAREAGVSYATVSRVVNNKNSILPEKRARVLAAMQRLGYVPNMHARKLAGGRSHVVGVVLHEMWSSYGTEILRGVDEELAASNYDLMLYTSRQRPRNESAHVAALTQGLADGLLLLLPRGLETYLKRLRQQHFPFVLIDHEGVENGGPAVGATNFQGAYDATRYLLQLGHQRIGFITGDLTVLAARDRLAGYRSALGDHGIACEPELIQEGDFFHPRAHARAQRLLSLDQRPTAIFASNDVSAFGVVDAAREMGLSIPDDLSLVGFDDIPQSRYMHPALTTVRQPLEDMGRVAARMLLATIGYPQRAPERVELTTELVVRASCAVPKEVSRR